MQLHSMTPKSKPLWVLFNSNHTSWDLQIAHKRRMLIRRSERPRVQKLFHHPIVSVPSRVFHKVSFTSLRHKHVEQPDAASTETHAPTERSHRLFHKTTLPSFRSHTHAQPMDEQTIDEQTGEEPATGLDGASTSMGILGMTHMSAHRRWAARERSDTSSGKTAATSNKSSTRTRRWRPTAAKSETSSTRTGRWRPHVGKLHTHLRPLTGIHFRNFDKEDMCIRYEEGKLNLVDANGSRTVAWFNYSPSEAETTLKVVQNFDMTIAIAICMALHHGWTPSESYARDKKAQLRTTRAQEKRERANERMVQAQKRKAHRHEKKLQRRKERAVASRHSAHRGSFDTNMQLMMLSAFSP